MGYSFVGYPFSPICFVPCHVICYFMVQEECSVKYGHVGQPFSITGIDQESVSEYPSRGTRKQDYVHGGVLKRSNCCGIFFRSLSQIPVGR